jgi:hypothetical protein
MWDFAEVRRSNQRNINIARKMKGKCFLFFLNKVSEKGPRTIHFTHLKKIRKICSHPS